MTTELVKTGQTVGAGFDNVDPATDMVLPRTILIQPSTIIDGKSFQTGDIVHNLSFEKIGGAGMVLEFIPVYMSKSYSRINPQKGNVNFDPAYPEGKTIWKTNDRTDPRIGDGLKWGAQGEKPVITEAYNFLCLLPKQITPIIISMKSSSVNTAKRIIALTYNVMNPATSMWSKKLSLASKVERGTGVYAVYTVEFAGNPTQEETETCEFMYKAYAHKVAEPEEAE